MSPIQSISIIGAGAMGAFYASRFFDMDPRSISFIAGGKRHQRLSGNGLIVNDRHYLIPVLKPEEKTLPADLLIVAVKHHHLDEAIGQMANRVGDHTLILSVMNGIDSEERIASVYGWEKVLYAVAMGIDAVRVNNRVTYSQPGKLFFGEAGNDRLTDRVKRLQALFDRAGLVHETPADMIRVLWWKYMINVAVNQVSAVGRAPYGVFQKSEEARALMVSAMKEVISVAKAADVMLSEKDIEQWNTFLHTLSPGGKTSMLQDVEARRKTEVEMFSGKLMELGKTHGIPTPVNETLYRLLKVIEGGWQDGQR